ncbi:hypothetical protein DPX16_10466 [Anabarilius grahami]|uniref:Uncharacterized protein n=1 Tax=Anabarilius grahami TaxID=495550 RepID=A0A3N0Z6U0_ANAGA|nr:hypothetical protein DPX16_10466 [Anabarilius grahami]
MGRRIISPPLIPLDVLPLPTWPLKEKLCSWTRISPTSAISEPFGNANHPRTAMRESRHFGKPRPAACNLTSAISRALLKEAKRLICQSGECEHWRGGSKINEDRFIQVYGLCPLVLIRQRCVVNKAASCYGVLACTQLVNKRLHISLRLSSNALSAGAKPQADYCQAYPMIFRLFCNATTRLLTCRSCNA